LHLIVGDSKKSRLFHLKNMRRDLLINKEAARADPVSARARELPDRD